jgi:DNA-directed RNA polymerase subunit RPC12/RpoP
MKEGFVFPEVSAATEERPARCPRCGHFGMGRHRTSQRPLTDLKVSAVSLVQYQCGACGKSVTIYPPGVPEGCRHSSRTKVLSVVLWGLGLSYENVSRLMKALTLPISNVGVLENVRALGEVAMKQQKQVAKSRMKLPVLGADETQVKLSGNGVTVGFLTDPASGQIVGMEVLASREGEELARWIGKAARHFGAKVLVSDDLESYKPAVEKLGLSHQLCLAHVRKAVARRIKKITGYDLEKEAIRQAIRELTPPAKDDLSRLHQIFARARPPRKGQRQSPEYSMRMLTLDLLENWNRLVCYQQTEEPFADNLGRRKKRSYAVPSTNNATENAIGRGGKCRAKRMRGFKRADTILPLLLLLASLGGVLAGVPFSSLLR